MTTSPAEHADRFAAGRARVAVVLACFMLFTQAGSWRAEDLAADGTRGVHVVALIIWSVVVLAFLVLGGGLFLNARTRALVNDESTLNHCRQAMAMGFVTAIVMGGVVYLTTMIEPVSAQTAVRLIITFTVVMALLRFGILERRALKDG
jgi:succinate dehydrogenase hydrophobic anchor subunit